MAGSHLVADFNTLFTGAFITMLFSTLGIKHLKAIDYCGFAYGFSGCRNHNCWVSWGPKNLNIYGLLIPQYVNKERKFSLAVVNVYRISGFPISKNGWNIIYEMNIDMGFISLKTHHCYYNPARESKAVDIRTYRVCFPLDSIVHGIHSDLSTVKSDYDLSAARKANLYYIC